MVDKQSPEAQVMVQKIEALYSEVANLPQRIKFINTPLLDDNGKADSIYVVDPDGQLIELNQYKPDQQ